LSLIGSNDALSAEEVDDLYRRYGFFLQRRCRLILRDPAAADDALQEAFVRLMRKGAGVRAAEHPLRWLHRVVDRTCLDQLRRGKRSRATLPLSAAADLVGAHPGVPLEIRDAVLHLLERLSEEDQAIAVLTFVDGMTQELVAGEMGLSRPTVNKRVQAIKLRAERLLGAVDRGPS